MAKKKIKKYKMHPITGFIFLIFVTIFLSAILSLFNITASYDSVNLKTGELEETIVTVKNMVSYDGIKSIIGNASTNFISFTTVSTIIITLIGVAVAEESGLVQTLLKRKLSKINPKILTFILFLLAVFSSIVNEVGYAVLIPLGALLFLFNGRNPLVGIMAAFAGVAFGYSVSFFVGATDMSLIPYTIGAAQLIDESFYVRMTSNVYIMLFSCIVIALVGTIITEKYIVKKMGRYVSKTKDDLDHTKEIEYLDLRYEEQKKLKEEESEKKGLKYALIASLLVLFAFVYTIVPGLPLSGMLLDQSQESYAYQLFGETSYFVDGFTYMLSLFLIITGVAYAFGAKSVKNDKELVEKVGKNLKSLGLILALVFFAAQFVAIFKETNIGTLIVVLLSDLLKALPLSGVLLIVVSIFIIAISNLFVPSTMTKWIIISPIFVPAMMQMNLSPQYSQFIFRASESMTNGITPLLAYFVLYVGYLNIYNREERKVYGIRDGIKLMMPYCIALSVTWIAILLLWYLVGLPLGPGSNPVL